MQPEWCATQMKSMAYTLFHKRRRGVVHKKRSKDEDPCACSPFRINTLQTVFALIALLCYTYELPGGVGVGVLQAVWISLFRPAKLATVSS